ncbi:MAG: hypothetical protein ABRQ38_02310 [Candidatus Eremiobacterota bacterium]
MEATFKLSINELDSIFLDKIKTVFPQSAMVEIKISNEYDEKDYLLSNHANSEALRHSIEQLKTSELIMKTQEELKI